eukprot:158580-Rhodomonas_salina.1
MDGLIWAGTKCARSHFRCSSRLSDAFLVAEPGMSGLKSQSEELEKQKRSQHWTSRSETWRMHTITDVWGDRPVIKEDDFVEEVEESFG